jgi:hypothetical protein
MHKGCACHTGKRFRHENGELAPRMTEGTIGSLGYDAALVAAADVVPIGEGAFAVNDERTRRALALILLLAWVQHGRIEATAVGNAALVHVFYMRVRERSGHETWATAVDALLGARDLFSPIAVAALDDLRQLPSREQQGVVRGAVMAARAGGNPDLAHAIADVLPDRRWWYELP